MPFSSQYFLVHVPSQVAAGGEVIPALLESRHKFLFFPETCRRSSHISPIHLIGDYSRILRGFKDYSPIIQDAAPCHPE